MERYLNYSEAQWETGKRELKEILRRRAAERGMMPYSELSSKLTTILLPAFGAGMSEMLGQVSEEEEAEGRGLLTVIVVHKYGDMEPGQGFYDLAEKLGYDTSDKVKLWVRELHKVHDYWANGQKWLST